MKLLNLREVAELLGITHETARQYASKAARYPDFPAEHHCPTCEGTGHGRLAEEIVAWDESRPGRGGGDFRHDRSAAGKKSWETRRENERGPRG